MYLADRDIRDLLEEMGMRGPHEAYPFDAETQVQPCSIDLRVSNVFWKPSRRRWIHRLLRRRRAVDLRRRSGLHELDPLRDWEKAELSEGEVVTIRPGQVVMGRIYERFRIPAGHAGKIEGRSSFARLGLAVHATGDFINPGWEGYMPLQLFNAGPYPLRVPAYISLCQLMLVRLSGEPDRSYGHEELRSKYINDDGGPSLWWRDAQVQALRKRLAKVNATERIQQDVIDRVRFQSVDSLERFERFLARRPLGKVDSANQLLDDFAALEDRRRAVDRVAPRLAPILTGVAFGRVFVDFGPPLVIVILLALVSIGLAVRGYERRKGGYLGRSELREAPDRPEEASS